MILCVTLNPVVDTTFFIDRFEETYRTEVRRVAHLAGGKGNNVARALKCLGSPARVFNPLGGTYGRLLEELLLTEGIEQIPGWISGETRVVVTLVDPAHEQRAYFAPPAAWTEADAVSVRECFQRSLAGCQAVAFAAVPPASWQIGYMLNGSYLPGTKFGHPARHLWRVAAPGDSFSAGYSQDQPERG